MKPRTVVPELTVQNVSVQFGGLAALSDISLTVDAGTVLGIIGPNGAGKTTLLNVVSGLQAPVRGEVRFRDRRMTGMRSSRIAQAGLGRSFQMAEGFGAFSVLDYVRLGTAAASKRGHAVSRSDKRQACEAVLDQVGLANRRRHPMGTLPYGTKKVVDLCRAVVSDPDVLLLDEPTSGLSESDRAEMVDHLADLRRRPNGLRTLVVVDHDVGFVSKISDRLFALAYGRALAHGLPHEVLSEPAVVAAYLG